MIDKNKYGQNGFYWFFGIVENRADPLNLGRLQVRAFLYHNDALDKVPTADLIWAQVMMPINSASVSGIGESPTGAVEGTQVFGFFMDGVEMQMPFILGSVPSLPVQVANTQKGFNDQRTNLSSYPVDPINGSAQNFPFIAEEPDTNRLARAENLTKTLKASKTQDSATTAAHTSTGLPGDNSIAAQSLQEPAYGYNAKYPFNSVRYTESGHAEEWDDTLGSERIHRWHRKGTYEELQSDGSRVLKSVANRWETVHGNSTEHVGGQRNIIVDGQATIKVNGLVIEVSGNNYNLSVDSGSANFTINGNWNMKVSGDVNEQITGNVNRTVGGNVTETVTGTVTQQAVAITHITPQETITGNLAVEGGMSVTGTNVGGGTASFAGDIRVTGSGTFGSNVAATGDVTAGTISLEHHVHGGVQNGSGTTGAPQ